MVRKYHQNHCHSNNHTMRSQVSILAVVRSSETTIKSCGQVSKITNSSSRRVSFKESNFFPSISHQSMYLCFECPPAIQWFRTVVNRRLMFCKHRLVARTRPYAVLSEVKCLKAFFCSWPLMYCSNMQTQRLPLFGRTWVLQNVALLKQSVGTTAREKF